MWKAVGRPLGNYLYHSATISSILPIILFSGKVLAPRPTCPKSSVWGGPVLKPEARLFGITGREMTGTAEGLAAKLGAVPNVDIDEGTFKYILLKVKAGTEHKYIVRGYGRAGFHADIYDEVEPGLRTLGLDVDCIGGGRIKHMPKAKSIFVYGYSQGFGRADHSITTDILKGHFKGYASITWSNEGY